MQPLPRIPDAPASQAGASRFWASLAFASLRPMSSVLLLALAALLPSCRPDPRADLILHNGREPETLDPHLLTGQADGRVASALFEGLTRYDPVTGNAIPGLAASWSLSPDGLRYTFQIRTNAAWSDGRPILAEDVVWSFRRAVDPLTGADYASQYFYVENGEAISTGKERDLSKLGVDAVSRSSVVIRLHHPTPFFLELLASRVFAVIPREAVERGGDRWILQPGLPCSGPYTLASWRVNDRIRLRCNPHYWDASNVRAGTIDVLAGDSAHTALNQYLVGDVDFILDKDMFPSELAEALQRRPDFHCYTYLGAYFIRFNTTRKPFDDPRVRKAIAMAIDRTRIVQRITRMGEPPASHLVPQGTGGYQPPMGLGRNPEAARRLLAEAGYPGGNGLRTFEYSYNAESRLHEHIAVEIQSALHDVLGLRMELRPLEWKTYLNNMSRLDYDLMRSSWIGDYNDPNTFLDLFLADGGNNRTGWRDPSYDALIHEANATLDRARRFQLLAQAEAHLLRDAAPIVPLYSYVGFYALDAQRLAGVHPNLLDEHPFWAIHRTRRP